MDLMVRLIGWYWVLELGDGDVFWNRAMVEAWERVVGLGGSNCCLLVVVMTPSTKAMTTDEARWVDSEERSKQDLGKDSMEKMNLHGFFRLAYGLTLRDVHGKALIRRLSTTRQTSDMQETANRVDDGC